VYGELGDIKKFLLPVTRWQYYLD